MSRQKNSEGVWLGGGDSPLILLIFFPLSYFVPHSKRSGSTGRHEELSVPRGGGGGGGVLRISSDRDDRRIFWGLKFSISGFFGVGKF